MDPFRNMFSLPEKFLSKPAPSERRGAILPFMMTSPSSGVYTPDMIFKRVLFPAPL